MHTPSAQPDPAAEVYHYLIYSAVDPTCPDCGQATHTMEHWLLKCLAVTEARIDILGRSD